MVNSLQSQINDHLVKVLSFICKNPLIFVSESDVHQLVIHELMNIPELNRLYNTECPIGNRVGIPSQIYYKTTILHKEYGHTSSAYSRSDFVILNKSDIGQIDDPLNLKRKNQWLIPDYIFEFGTEKSAGSSIVFKRHVKNDLKKIATAKVQGYLIHIHRNYYVSTGDRKVKNEEKIEQYVEKIKEEINTIRINPDFSLTKLPNIIFIVIDLGGEGRIVRGKIRILKNPFTSKCKLTRCNLEKIEGELKSIIF